METREDGLEGGGGGPTCEEKKMMDIERTDRMFEKT
jgi:hypothetical protein